MARLTQQEFADHVGVDKSAISRMVRNGLIDLKEGIDEARLAYIARLREQAAGRLGADAGEYDLTSERARLAHHQANKTALEEGVMSGDLIPSEEVIRAWGDMVTKCRSKMLALPGKLATKAMAATSLREVEDFARAEIYNALAELADAIRSGCSVNGGDNGTSSNELS